MSVAIVAAPSADAYVHSWSCYRYSTNDCSDTTGTTYNPWLEVLATSGYSVYHICAEGVTAAGNQRSTIDGVICNVNTFVRDSCLISTSPDSQGKVHWTDSSYGFTIQLQANAYTAPSSAC